MSKSKREQIITDNLTEGLKVDLLEIIQGDIVSLDKMGGATKEKLHNITKSINSLLKNPDVSLGEELVSLYADRTKNQEKLDVISKVKLEYLPII